MGANNVSRKICINRKVLFLFIGAVIFIGVYLAATNTLNSQKKRAHSAKASESPVTNRVVRGAVGDFYADIILGKPRFEEVIPKEIVPYKLAGPAGVLVDVNGQTDRVYIYDGMNSRILGYKSTGTCTMTFAPCSKNDDCDPSKNCVQQIGKSDGIDPDIVIGQISATGYGACNRDASFASYPQRKPAGPNTICGMREDEQSYFEGGSAAGMDVDAQSNLFFPDPFNHRILKYRNPFDSDRIADEVWGQDNFTANSCNKGQANSPDASSLCFVHRNYAKPAVHIDRDGNLWVADVGNNRILRFPADSQGRIAKTADLVLGQRSFTSRGSGSATDQLNAPNSLTFGSDGSLYVSDFYNHRILRYPYPQSTGMNGVVQLSNLTTPHSVRMIRPNKMIVSVSNFVEVYEQRSTSDEETPVFIRTATYPALESYGSIGVFEDGSFMYSNSAGWQNISHYDLSGTLTTLFDTSDIAGNGYDAHNLITTKGFHSLRGIAITDSQIIVADAHRLAYWNGSGPEVLANGKEIDGYFGVENGKKFSTKNFLRIAKGSKYVWVLTQNIDNADQNIIQKYTLPVTQGQLPSETIRLDRLYVLDGNQIPQGKIMPPSDIYVDELNEYMWIALPWNDRVIRVRMPGKYYQNYTIDAIIGGYTIPDRTPGWELSCSAHPHYPHSLCYPGSLNEDRWGNLYISDMMLENAGSRRFLIYKHSSLPLDSTILTLDVDDAWKVIADAEAWKPAFNSQNVMVVGHYPFANTHNNRFPSVFDNILINDSFNEADKLTDYYAQAFTMEFDSHDNLYIAELNRGSLYVYKEPFSYDSVMRPYKPVMIQKDNTEVCLTKDQSFYRACEACGNNGVPLARVCPQYCSQFDGNIHGCVASERRGFGCVWEGKINRCINSYNTLTGNERTYENPTDVLFSGSVTYTYKSKRPDAVFVRLEKWSETQKKWIVISTKHITDNPEKEIPYTYVFNDEGNSSQLNHDAQKLLDPQSAHDEWTHFILQSVRGPRITVQGTYRISAYGVFGNDIALPADITYSHCSGTQGVTSCVMTQTGSTDLSLDIDGCTTMQLCQPPPSAPIVNPVSPTNSSPRPTITSVLTPTTSSPRPTITSIPTPTIH